jgi:2-phosphosulfolactate phosphatase
VAGVDEAFALRDRLPSAVLGGERGMRAIQGFDAGNSPRDYLASLVRGREVVLTTTNGTLALARAHTAKDVAFAGLTTAPLAATWLLAQEIEEALIVMSGTDGHFSYEDALTAGAIAAGLPDVELDDLLLTAIAAFKARRRELALALRTTPHGKRLIDAGFEADIDLAARLGRGRVLPVRDGRQKSRLIAWRHP